MRYLRVGFASFALLCVVTVSLVASDPPGNVVKLKTAPIENPGSVLCKPEMNGALKVSSFIQEDNLLSGVRNLQFHSGAKGLRGQVSTVTIAGQEYSLQLDEKEQLVIQASETERFALNTDQIKQFQRQEIKLPGGLGCVLAYRVNHFSKQKGMCFAQIGVRSGSVQKGELGGEDLSVYDNNMDGSYDTSNDGMRVGKSNGVEIFAPISEYVATKGGIYRFISLSPDGSQLTLAKENVKGGTIEAKWGGADGFSLDLVMGSTKPNLNFAMTLSGKDPAAREVIPASYKILYGVVTKAGKPVACVLPGAFEPLAVAGGKRSDVTLGDGLRMAFKASVQAVMDKKTGVKEDQIVIDGTSVKVRGKSGEEYLAPYDTKTPPSVNIRHEGKVVASGKMKFG